MHSFFDVSEELLKHSSNCRNIMPTQAARRRARVFAKAKARAMAERSSQPDSEPEPENPTPEISNCDTPGCPSEYGRHMECCGRHICFTCAWGRMGICICGHADARFFMICPFCENKMTIDDDLMKSIMARECPDHQRLMTTVCGPSGCLEIPLTVVHRPGPRGCFDCKESYFTVYLGGIQVRGPSEQ